MYCIINDFKTSALSDCQLVDIGEVRAAEPRRVESATVYGANGRVEVLDGAYDGYERTLTFFVKRLSDIGVLIEKFQLRKNQLEFWYQPDSVFYCDYLGSRFQPWGMHAWRVDVEVYMHPFRYLKEAGEVRLVRSGSIVNPGTVYSEPIILLEGQGDVSLTIGNQTMHLSLDTRATIDCTHKEQKILDKNGAVKNTIRKRGPFFELPVGRSGITSTGNITQIIIKGKWRYKI